MTEPDEIEHESTEDEESGERSPDSKRGLSASDELEAPPRSRKFCPKCNQPAPVLDDGTCLRCKSLVAAKTLPFAVRSMADLKLSRTGRFEDEDSAPGQALADPLIGVVVADRYRICELLGRGGMGIVYKVEHTRIGKLLAMKLLAGELSRNQEVVRRFKTEALTASKLSSPNTVQVFDYGASEGLTYLVMELVTGDDLGKVLKLDGKMAATRVGRIVVQVASSLAEAHQQGIVHRDIKPENVMLLKARDGSDLAKVLDFGLAKLREGSELSELTSQGAVVGTPYFMSPEQVRGDPVDNRSDIYSLGALMYRALTGVYPFQGSSPMAVFAKHLTEDPVAPCDIDPSVPVGMSEIVMRALRKDPGERFQRVEDMQAAVVEQLQELGTSGIETLLDSGALRKLAPKREVAEAKDAPAIATRDELEGYESKLRRNRIVMTTLALAVPLLGLGFGVHYLVKERPVVFSGVETEPNNEVAEANEVPFGHGVAALLGKRASPTQSDIDFFRIEVPPGSKAVSVDLTSLPNIPICAQIFRRGQVTPSGQYCTGRAGSDLTIPALRLEPGPYVFAVIEDMDGRGATNPLVMENVSDSYVLTVAEANDDPAYEVEPDDEPSSAQTIKLGEKMSGTLGWAGDVDVLCPKVEGTDLYRYVVSDDVREGGGVLSVSLIEQGSEGPAVRVHSQAATKQTATDAPSPFNGFEFRGATAACLTLRQVVDTSGGARPEGMVPRGSKAEWHVTLESAP
ncbi:MAG TPA: serine/threonine-protein kinase [Polyangiaceae bacterium]|nr:serine/threonine-protein kinase [Polyangiaceae bacterium]